MKCPACENDVPSGESACARCGAPLPSAGERPGPEPRFASGAPNPTTEPFPVPVWDVAEERPPARFPRTDGTPPEPGPAAQDLGAPAPHPRPLEYDRATQNLTTPAAGSPPLDRPGWSPAPPGPDPMQVRPDPATQNLGAPWTDPVPPPGYPPADWNQGVPPFGGEPAGDRTAKSRKVPLLAGGIAVAAVLVGGLVYALTQGLPGSEDKTGASAGSAGATQQAAAVNEVLKSGKTAHGHLPSRLRTCDDVSAGVSGFQQVVRDRQRELSQSKGLTVDRLPDGSRLRQSMITAYQSSLDADQAYLAWAREIQARGCGGRTAPLTGHYKDAISANDKAGPAKRQVATLWKPIASSHGLPTYAWNRL
jgi:hypothetical protein